MQLTSLLSITWFVRLAPGRPILVGTTEEFLRSFGITSLEDLPVINPEVVEDFKQEAEEEVQLKLEV